MFLTLLLSIHSIFECGFHLRMNEIWRQTLFHTFKLMPSKHQEQLILTWIYLTMQDHKRRLTQGSWPNVDLSYKEWLHVNQDQIIQLIISFRWTTSQASLTVTYFSSLFFLLLLINDGNLWTRYSGKIIAIHFPSSRMLLKRRWNRSSYHST